MGKINCLSVFLIIYYINDNPCTQSKSVQKYFSFADFRNFTITILVFFKGFFLRLSQGCRKLFFIPGVCGDSELHCADDQ